MCRGGWAKDGAGDGGDGAVGGVESQRDHTIGAFAGFPVIEAQSFEHEEIQVVEEA